MGGGARATEEGERARGSPRGPDGERAKGRGSSGVVATKGGDTRATDVGGARPRCDGNVRARGVSGGGDVWTSTGDAAGTVTGDRGDVGIATCGVEAARRGRTTGVTRRMWAVMEDT